MDLTPEQQGQLDIQVAVENTRHANQLVLQAKQAKLEAVRMAKETLVENARSKPADSREVTAADIATFATTLTAYIDA
jgi:hypothetical protein